MGIVQTERRLTCYSGKCCFISPKGSDLSEDRRRDGLSLLVLSPNPCMEKKIKCMAYTDNVCSTSKSKKKTYRTPSVSITKQKQSAWELSIRREAT